VEAGHIDVLISVVVVISHGDSGPRSLLCDPGARRDVGEGSVMVVVKQSAAGPPNEKDVHPAIVVVINERAAAAKGFNVGPGPSTVVGPTEFEPGSERDVHKVRATNGGTPRMIRGLSGRAARGREQEAGENERKRSVNRLGATRRLGAMAPGLGMLHGVGFGIDSGADLFFEMGASALPWSAPAGLAESNWL